MSKNVRTQIGKVVGKSLDAYHKRMKPTVDELKFKEQYQGRIIDCMVGEVDDNYIEIPLTDENIVKLEHSKEGVIKIPQIKGKTILIDADGNETDTPGEGCKLVSVGEEEDNKLIILSKNTDATKEHKTEILLDEPLRKIDDTIYDEIIDNKMVRRTCKYIITENTSFNYDTELNDRVGFVVKNSVISNQKLGGKIISNKFTYVKDNNDKYNSDYRITLGLIPNYPIVFTLPKVILDINDEDNGSYPRIEKLKKWLKENPIEVIYELAEPIIKELPNSITLQGFDDTTMYIENSITPTVTYGYNALIRIKKNLELKKKK